MMGMLAAGTLAVFKSQAVAVGEGRFEVKKERGLLDNVVPDIVAGIRVWAVAETTGLPYCGCVGGTK